MYEEYVTKKYLNSAVVFDGYSVGPSTKDAAHLRRKGTAAGAEVKFTEDMHLKSKKQQVLTNTTNKQWFIHLLSEEMKEKG